MRFLFAVVFKEMRTILRSTKAFSVLRLILLFSGAIFLISWANMSHYSSLSDRAMLSRSLFGVMTFVELIGLGLISPIMTATAITGERENKTLELLYCTPISRFHILAGKWIAAIFFQMLVVVCMLPILSLSFQLGGVSLDEYLFVAAIVAMTVCTYGMIGLANSTRFRRTPAALFSSLLMVFFIATFLPLGLIIFTVMGLSVLDGDIEFILLFALVSLTFLSFALIGFKRARRFRTFVVFAFVLLLIADILLVSYNFVKFADAFVGSSVESVYGFLVPVSPIYTLSLLSNTFFSTRAGPSGIMSLLANPIFLWHVAYQALFFALAAMVGWRGMGKIEAEHASIAKEIIDDKKILKRRRGTWPFYLIDPLQREKEIGDRKNPMFIKELRVGTLIKGRILVRLAYAAVFFSFFGCAFQFLSEDILDWAKALNAIAISIVLPFIPIVASTLVSKEREENTLDLLRTTLLSPDAIMRGKLHAALRFLITLFLCVFLFPFAFYVGVPLYEGRLDLIGFLSHSFSVLYLLFKITLPVASFIALYASLCLLFSSIIKRNVSAIIVSYLFIPFLLFLPVIFLLLYESADLLRHGPLDGAAFLLRDTILVVRGAVCPLLSPYYYLFPFQIDHSGRLGVNFFTHDVNLFTHWDNIAQTLIHTALVLLLSHSVLKRAANRLEAGRRLKSNSS